MGFASEASNLRFRTWGHFLLFICLPLLEPYGCERCSTDRSGTDLCPLHSDSYRRAPGGSVGQTSIRCFVELIAVGSRHRQHQRLTARGAVKFRLPEDATGYGELIGKEVVEEGHY